MIAPAKTQRREGLARIPAKALKRHEQAFINELDEHLPRFGKNGHGFSYNTLCFKYGDASADFENNHLERIQKAMQSGDYADLGRAWVENFIIHIGQQMEVEIDAQEAVALAEKKGYLP